MFLFRRYGQPTPTYALRRGRSAYLVLAFGLSRRRPTGAERGCLEAPPGRWSLQTFLLKWRSRISARRPSEASSTRSRTWSKPSGPP
jgi:hypothetical protein